MADLATGLNAIVESSSTMTTWALAVGAGSVAAIVSTSYLRPKQAWARLFYALFPVGWLLLALSIFHGNAIARAGVAASLTNSRPMMLQIGADMNTAYIAQQNWLMLGFGAFALWLLLYLIWWIWTHDLSEEHT